ncbi:Dabb family protein [Bacillus sp. B15-48]|uniref:Dabb family protein n=1 Tax=Bacillus sp. B15-48 TaxID=1548601 RepID=UPI00193F9183|nr:Dabb family protein [Bacillus sp. B15-48]MBM4763542.1 Dabb family protein [Bacillus sp. B15-48]
MIEHLTFINFSRENSEAKVAEVIEKIKAFKREIPGVVDAQAGVNFAEGYDFGLSVRFKDKQAFEEYMVPHPKHQEVGELLGEMGMSEYSVVDFEF